MLRMFVCAVRIAAMRAIRGTSTRAAMSTTTTRSTRIASPQIVPLEIQN
nr:MAG TPA: hypothetical protein [Caudoviricetes sp.]